MRGVTDMTDFPTSLRKKDTQRDRYVQEIKHPSQASHPSNGISVLEGYKHP